MRENGYPRVTVLLPVYNGSAYLVEAVESILAQTLRKFELLVIDDGSTDGSPDLVSSFDDPRIRLIRQDANRGLVAALNLGIGLARGEYIARMDADDVSLPHRLERQVEFMDRNQSVGVCGSWLETFTENRRVLWSAPLHHEAIVARLLFESSLYHPTVIIRKSILDVNQLRYSSDFSRAQDYELWSRCTMYCRLANIGEVLLRYRLHDMSVGSLESSTQLESADRVRSSWLAKFDLRPTSAELKLHRQLSLGDIDASYAFLERSHLWLKKLGEANATHSVFAHVELLQELAARWFLTCNRATQIGPAVIRQYMSSHLSRHFSGNRIDVAALAVKSVLRWAGK